MEPGRQCCTHFATFLTSTPQILHFTIVEALKRENDSYETLMLTSDGDTEFDARGVALLRDELLKDPNRGAVCGRIRPCGNNGMIMFFQSFEYAAGHWFQKTAEDSLGSVLCCPGAFSMFRMKAIQDIADTYSSVARGAKDFFLMDQGEDRWMSLLLLEKGYQLTYCSQAEAMTEAPDNLGTFFDQRRRWILSTMANTWELLAKGNHLRMRTLAVNTVFLIYVGFGFISTLMSPGAVTLLIASTLETFMGLELPATLTLASLLPVLFVLIEIWHRIPNPKRRCWLFRGSPADRRRVHLLYTEVAGTILALTIVALLVSFVLKIVTDPLALQGMLLVLVIMSYVLAGIMHPSDLTIILYGFVYLLLLPTIYMLLPLYTLFNADVMSWGTRDAVDEEEFTLLLGPMEEELRDLMQRFMELGPPESDEDEDEDVILTMPQQNQITALPDKPMPDLREAEVNLRDQDTNFSTSYMRDGTDSRGFSDGFTETTFGISTETGTTTHGDYGSVGTFEAKGMHPGAVPPVNNRERLMRTNTNFGDDVVTETTPSLQSTELNEQTLSAINSSRLPYLAPVDEDSDDSGGSMTSATSTYNLMPGWDNDSQAGASGLTGDDWTSGNSISSQVRRHVGMEIKKLQLMAIPQQLRIVSQRRERIRRVSLPARLPSFLALRTVPPAPSGCFTA